MIPMSSLRGVYRGSRDGRNCLGGPCYLEPRCSRRAVGAVMRLAARSARGANVAPRRYEHQESVLDPVGTGRRHSWARSSASAASHSPQLAHSYSTP
jgi:hypothetical protein